MIEILYLLSCDILIEIDSGRLHDVLAGIIGLPLRKYLRVIYDRKQLLTSVPVADSLHQRPEIILRAIRKNLVLRIMMVNSVAEEHPLGIDGEILKFPAFPVAFIIFKNVLEDFPYRKVIPAVLYPYDVPAVLCSLAQVIYILFLLKGQVIPAGNLILHYLQVRELIYQISEIVCPVLRLASASCTRHCRGCDSCHADHLHYSFHFLISVFEYYVPDVRDGKNNKNLQHFQKSYLQKKHHVNT